MDFMDIVTYVIIGVLITGTIITFLYFARFLRELDLSSDSMSKKDHQQTWK